MPVSSIAAAPAGSSLLPATRAERGLGGLKSEDFFRLLVTELRQQDPFEPTKTADMLSQVSDIRNIELSGRLSEALDQLARQQRLGGLSELIGKSVSAIVLAADGTEQLVEGVVTGVRFDPDGTAILELDNGAAVRAQDVQRVSTVAAAEPQLASAGPTSDERQEDGTEAAKRRAKDRRGWLALDGALRL